MAVSDSTVHCTPSSVHGSSSSVPTDLINDSDNSSRSIKILSYNMHGYNQGRIALRDMILSLSPDIFLLQEHWL
jgi:hypothetical protein